MKLDEPVIFYLKHRQQIDEWAQLKKTANQAAVRFLNSVWPEAEERAKALGENVHLVGLFEIGYPKLFLIRDSWCDVHPSMIREEKDVKEMRVAVGLEWVRNSVQLSGVKSTLSPYSGVWFYPKRPGYDELEPEVRKRIGVPQDAAKNNWWAFYRYEHCRHEEVWDHLEEYREQLLDRLFMLWEENISHIDEAMAAATPVESMPQ